MCPIFDFDAHGPKNVWEIIVEPGWYPCIVGSVEELAEDKWRIRLNHLGQPVFEATDYLKFSGKAAERVKILYEALGLRCVGKRLCEPADLEGREVLAYVEPGTWNGQTRMKVSFDGYQAAGNTERTVSAEQRPSKPSAAAQPVSAADGEEVPF